MRRIHWVLWALALACAAVRAEEASTVEKCSKKFGTITVVDPRTVGDLKQYGLGSPSALLRMMIQQSACFDVVERGVAMQNIQQERALAQAGQLREDSNVGDGQIQMADFVMTPDVLIPTSTTGGGGGGLTSFGKLGGLIGGLAGSMKFREATTSLMIADVRSSIQIAAAEGKASKTDFSIGGWSVGGGGVGGGSSYTSTPEGKMVSASLLDNYNKIVVSIRDKATLIQPTTAEANANASGSTRAERPLPAGQMLAPKIGNVKVYSEPSRDSAVVGTLQRGDELVASGETQNGFARVDAANFSGWVQRTLVAPVAGAAPVAAAPPPVAPPAQMVMAAPQLRVGSFAGTADGSDKGSFRLTIDDRGHVIGDGSFARLGGFGLTGTYKAADGTLGMLGSSGGGSIIFQGRYDPSRGAISGSWLLGGAGLVLGGGSGGGGSFVAQQQP